MGSLATYACRCRCPRNGLCVCDQRIPHRLHICKRPDCYCHTEGRYADERNAYGPEVYPTERFVITADKAD